MSETSVLIIDDDELDRYLLKRLLGASGLDVHIFEEDDGSAALEFLQDHENNRQRYRDAFPPAILFLDINMPIVNGPEFLRQFEAMRVDQDNQGSVIMMFSSSDREEDRDILNQYEFVKDYLVKGSFTADDLGERVENVLEGIKRDALVH